MLLLHSGIVCVVGFGLFLCGSSFSLRTWGEYVSFKVISDFMNFCLVGGGGLWGVTVMVVKCENGGCGVVVLI